ncbi:DNA mismatch repair endonuclease MutL [Frisingicoccus caecimuris]|uniref:DNA mismatch repair protein MutL n=1 Tax=Frisingicoccus caecimuris TaxID=1796636 RepID=A0A4R2LG63_9FIRM|nr:DNA mismatch repair endonuclease MutL [Frisingicoccus caecimuris]MCR1918658.1 DNA mismatch repair endonuclease MutL [Frisingicoccus caecimuris]TCO86290.1 DNA mismatch repair protein MutL [Frisingicoccus caecimuris]
MGKIQVLDGETINKIAAGEVVERPSSVVKELVENAIDAGATAVTVEIQDGGTSLIRITDNGSGMEKDDISMAFLRHSTSKIRSAQDLQTIHSLGFRGEALSSISAVAQVELLTKTAHAMTGCRYQINGGVEKSMEDIGCPDGTTFIVRQLFYNTPARRKFLKSNITEAGYISDLMVRLSMSHPEVSFKFINNRQNRLHTSGNGRLKDILYHIYGRDISANLLPVEAGQKGVRMTGFIGKPIICRGNRSYENYFINGRYIKSPVITQAVEDAYKTFTMVHKFPFAILHFTLDTAELDVNVHPTKMEVRFSHGQELYKFIYETLRQVLFGRELIPEVKPSEPKQAVAVVPKPLSKPIERPVIRSTSGLIEHPTERSAAQTVTQPKVTPTPKPDIRPELKETEEKLPEPFEKKRLEALRVSTVEDKPQQYELFETGLLTKEARVRHKLIGQVFDTYWIVEYDGKLFIIDQHAAHEKVLYEKLMKRFKENQPMTQLIQPPIILTLSMTEMDLLNRYMDQFKKMGFEFESFGGKEYALRGVPSDLYGFTGKEMVIELLDELAGEFERMRTDVIGDKIATMACKAAVKGNMRISSKEADALIEELLRAENPYTCPHGRPTIISMTKTELEKRFKRIV